jgi:hypothetical protein
MVPRYFEGFGKRPDMLQYPSDIMGLVNKGATSFHGSEEHWTDPLSLSVDLTPTQLTALRKGWDLLIDIDAKYLEMSQIAGMVLLDVLERHGVREYGVKFSGSKGFHIIVPWEAFPKDYAGHKTSTMFPEWPKIIVEYLFSQVLPDYRREVSKRMTLHRTEPTKTRYECLQCHASAQEGTQIRLRCPVCQIEVMRKDYTLGERKLRCIARFGNKPCSGVLEPVGLEEIYWKCGHCMDPEKPTLPLTSIKYPHLFAVQRMEHVEQEGGFDLILVSSRHLFRAPYSLHEKSALASCVLTKQELALFTPRDAQPLTVMPKPYIPSCTPGCATDLLRKALAWKKDTAPAEEVRKPVSAEERVALTGVTEKHFPPAIQTLLGLKMEDGKKRGLFVLVTFLRACGFGEGYVRETVEKWNGAHPSPLRQAYVKAQLDWHFKQKKLILPPNYENHAFYRDLGILPNKAPSKNPLVDVQGALRRR